MRDLASEVLAAVKSTDASLKDRLLFDLLRALDRAEAGNADRREKWRQRKARQRQQLDLLPDVGENTAGDGSAHGIVPETCGTSRDIAGQSETPRDTPPVLSPPSPSLSSPTPLINPSSPAPLASAATAAARANAVVGKLVADHHRAAYARVTAVRTPAAVDFELRLLAEGGERPGVGLERARGWPLVGEALHQLAAAGREFTTRNMGTFVSDLETRAANSSGDPPVPLPRRPSNRPVDGAKLDEAVAAVGRH